MEWPKATGVAETWRYDEMKKCRDAIRAGVTPWKQSFDQRVADIGRALSEVIDSVSVVDSVIQESMSTLAGKAAQLWLDIASQRFRVIIMMGDLTHGPGGGRDPKELVLQPELRRFGNAVGEKLDRFDIVTGCRGKYMSFHSG